MKGDFTGFSFDGIHSSLLGIARVSDGNYYDDTILPSFEDRTNSVAGRDGEYYFGSDYGSKEITINIAFDSVTEKQLRLITNLFSSKKPRPLIFDERPYKMYMAKLSSPIELSYVCFDERERSVGEARDGIRVKNRTKIVDEETGDEIINIEREKIYPYVYSDKTQRIYKGEGTIEFICTEPFARAPFKKLENYEEGIENGNLITKYTNIEEWAETSGLLTVEQFAEDNIDVPIELENSRYTMEIKVYNPGDLDTPFRLYLPYPKEDEHGDDVLPIKGKGSDSFYVKLGENIMLFNPITRRYGGETGIMINTSNHLIEGVRYSSGDSSWQTTGEVYNDCLIKGDFPKIIHMGIDELINSSATKQTIVTNCDIDVNEVRLFYDYLYY